MSKNQKEEKLLENLRDSAKNLIQEIDDFVAKVSMNDYGVKDAGGQVAKNFFLYCHQNTKN